MDKLLLVYTMKGCPHCVDFKKMLDENKVDYYERDIDEYQEEYDLFVEITNNDMIPSLLIIEGDENSHESFLYAPERNYNELTEALDIIKGHRKNVGII